MNSSDIELIVRQVLEGMRTGGSPAAGRPQEIQKSGRVAMLTALEN